MFAPQKWRTSSDTFETQYYIGNLNIAFPEFSRSKKAIFRLAIVRIEENDPAPVYDLIGGVKRLANMGVVLDFATGILTIDKVFTLLMKDVGHLVMKTICTQFRELLEPIVMREATNRAIHILDAKYEKADI